MALQDDNYPASPSPDETPLPIHEDHAGYGRPLGFLRGDPVRMMAVSPYSAENELIPESEVDNFDEWPSEVVVLDQDGRGACNPFAGIQGMHLLRYVSGAPYVHLSPWFTYARLSGGYDRGSMILDCIEDLKKTGTCPDAEVPYAMINPHNLTEKAKSEAKRFKAEVGTRLTTAQELWTAILRREAINLAVCVGGQFNNLDSDGCPPRGSGYCNHAVTVAFGIKRSKSGEILGKMCNSWSTAWGLDGFCWLPLKKIVQAPAFEAYTLRSVIDDPQDASLPPVILA